MNHPRDKRILLTGASGFIGGRLLKALISEGYSGVRCLVRSPKRLRDTPPVAVNAVVGDLLKPRTLPPAFDSVDTAYYLVHSLETGAGRFVERDRRAAENFVKAADEAGIRRIIYVGGLGEEGDRLSTHLKSRREVGLILQSARAQVTTLRAATIMGAGSASFEMLRHLVERLPVMICPIWVHTRSQPIAIQNVIEYLLGCLQEPATAEQTFDIGGPDILSYMDLMRIYGRMRGLSPLLILTAPVLTPRLSSYWVELVTPVPPGVVRSLIEGLKNEAICKENRIRGIIPLELLTMEEAIKSAIDEVETERAAKLKRIP